MANAVDAIGGHHHNVVVAAQAQYLTDDEISRFLDDLDHNGDGLIDFDEVEQKLDAVHEELVPQPREHNFLARKKSMLMRRLSRYSRAETVTTSHVADDLDRHDGGNLTTTTTRTTVTARGSAGGAISRLQSPHHHSPEGNLRHEFLRSIIGSDARQIPRAEFAERVRQWNIPSLELHQPNRDYMRKMSIFRRLSAYWAVHGPEIAFLMLVIGLQVAFGTWQLVKYASGSQYRKAFGWGVGMAKAFAGALYPTMFFLIISMSRYLSTLLRRWHRLSRFINWDLSQSFHIKISIVAMCFATLHAIGHFSGTFHDGSQVEREDEVAAVLGTDDVPIPYAHYIVSVPGTSGIVALGMFYLLALLSLPQVRRWNYEVFQLGHLLMYPIIGLLFAHGTSGLLQWPMLGYWMAGPVLLILLERAIRIGVGFYKIRATVRILDGDTVEVAVTIPSERLWVYKPGQYVFFQVPRISRFQWHPFTVSVYQGKKIQLHIKTDGNWTRRLRELADESGSPTDIIVGINGPFGSPAQRFYDFDHSIVVGSGIGVTPFSGILSDLQAKDDALHGRPKQMKKMQEWNGPISPASEKLPPLNENEPSGSGAPGEKRPKGMDENINSNSHGDTNKTGNRSKKTPKYRRVDFHWTVRERNYLLWMSELLNSVFLSQQWHRQQKLDEQRRRQFARRAEQGGNSGNNKSEATCPKVTRRLSYIPPASIPAPCSTKRTTGHHHPPSTSPDKDAVPASQEAIPSPPRPRPTPSQPTINPVEGEEEEEDFDTLPSLDIRIFTHVTGMLSSSRNIATHVYAWLLEMHRTPAHPASPLTGLLNPTQFGRPDFVAILDSHYDDMVRLKARDLRRKEAERIRRERVKEWARARDAQRKRERKDRERDERGGEKKRVIHGYYSKATADVSTSFLPGRTGKYTMTTTTNAIANRGGNMISSVGGGTRNWGYGANRNTSAENSTLSFGSGGGAGDAGKSSYRSSNSNLTTCPTASSSAVGGKGGGDGGGGGRGGVDSLYVFSSSTSRNPYFSGQPCSADNRLPRRNGEEGPVGAGTAAPPTSKPNVPPLSDSTIATTAGIGRGIKAGEDIIRVGVFYCGTPAVGEILADRCRALTARGHQEGSGIEYHFMTEVFG